jgi:hypothetical protein
MSLETRNLLLMDRGVSKQENENSDKEMEKFGRPAVQMALR